MIHSMTAYARRQRVIDNTEIIWEMRSVNHRYLETYIRLPEVFRSLEPKIRGALANALGRGKIECQLQFNPSSSDASELRINEVLVKHLLEAANNVGEMMADGRKLAVPDVLRWPGVLESAEHDYSPLESAVMELLDETVKDLIQTREREGERLAEIVLQRCDSMLEQVEAAKHRIPVVIANLRRRMIDRLGEIAESVDNDRLEQEMVLALQKLDVDEEMDRLGVHIEEVKSVLSRTEPIGRRLDFLMQELNREANTLGSKSADSETTAISVEMKVLIEQMREQIQNIE